MIKDEKILRIIELIKNNISKKDFEFFISNANHYSNSVNAYGNQLPDDQWENFFKSHQKANSLDQDKINLIFRFLHDFYPDSYSILSKKFYAFKKQFPTGFDFTEEIDVFKIIEFYKS